MEGDYGLLLADALADFVEAVGHYQPCGEEVVGGAEAAEWEIALG